ncbi:phosphoribosylanthranilate isomerase [Pedobacter sp. HMF7647]|uniref:N-(5'-phosphoribosyl)anthranilate isomerase n=2 Tax=Hufsiella arboris TaxID=2695275 RepID=A0A7K1YCJ6_9SPHI|nr:phosphoribosylanthranilate isomerase [Hufsiella arboris]
MRDAENIVGLAALNPHYLGLIFYPQSKRFAGDLNPGILKHVPGKIIRTGVFVNASKAEIGEKISQYGLKAVQLHGDETPQFCNEIKNLNVEVIKAFGLDESFDFGRLNQYIEYCDYFLFDTQTAAYGGSGKSFDWSLLQHYTLSKPYFLSGGIDEVNIDSILEMTDERLYAIDLNSKFESEPGLKDLAKLDKVFRKLKTARAEK